MGKTFKNRKSWNDGYDNDNEQNHSKNKFVKRRGEKFKKSAVIEKNLSNYTDDEDSDSR